MSAAQELWHRGREGAAPVGLSRKERRGYRGACRSNFIFTGGAYPVNCIGWPARPLFNPPTEVPDACTENMASILIVDDDDTVRDVLYDLFCDDHLCHTAPTAERALEWLASESYDVILTDVSMPGMSGLEFLARVRQHQPRTPVIVISGIDYGRFSGDLIDNMGASDYLVKPFDLQEAEGKMAGALSQRKRWLDEVTESVDRAVRDKV